MEGQPVVDWPAAPAAFHRLPVEDVLRRMATSPQGLTSGEADRRMLRLGPNRFERARQSSLLLGFLKEFTHFLALVLWLAAGLAFLMEARDPQHGMGILGGAIIGVIVLNALFSFLQAYRAERALAALERLLPESVRVMRDGQFVEQPAHCLVPGDLVALSAGDRIPADCRLIESFDVRVDNSIVTGESLPQSRDANPSTADDPLQSTNVLLAGTILLAGEARAVVFATAAETQFGRIAHLTQTAGRPRSPLQQEITRLSRLLALLAVTLGAIFFAAAYWIGLSTTTAFLFAIGIIVANVPEGLLPTVTLALAMGAQRMARRNILVRHLSAVETLGAATVICTDKTGTLTQNQMCAQEVFLDGDLRTVQRTVTSLGPSTLLSRLCETAALCHDLKRTDGGYLGDPTEIALVELAASWGFRAADARRLDEVPFDSDRKRVSTLYSSPIGPVLYCKGALETVLPLCSHRQLGDNAVALTPDWQAHFLAAERDMAHRGLRVLALAWRAVPQACARAEMERDLTLLGLIGLYDPPRPEVPRAVQTCRDAGIRVIMITGDHPQTALAVAREIGLAASNHPLVITGDALRSMSAAELQLALDAPELIFARILADQKTRVVAALQARKEIVAVTGDGVNDAPALARADIGIAMGVVGTDVARQAADMVLADDNFASIVTGIEEGRAVYANVRKFLTYILTSNVPELIPYIAFALSRIPLGLTIIQILAIDLGTDILPALALGAERPEPDIMSRPPRSRGRGLLDAALLMRAYLFLGILEAIAGMAAFLYVLTHGGWSYGDELSGGLLYQQATTACLTAIVVAQVTNLFVCRSERRSAFSFGWRDNALIPIAIACELALLIAIAYTPLGNRVFQTAPIGLEVWGFVLPFAAALLVLGEIHKWALRRFKPIAPA